MNTTKIQQQLNQLKSQCKKHGLTGPETLILLNKAKEIYFQGQKDQIRGRAEEAVIDMIDFANNLLSGQL